MEVTEDVDNDIDAYDLEQALSTFYQATEYGDLPDPDLNLPLEMNTLLGADSLLYGTEEMEPEIEGEGQLSEDFPLYFYSLSLNLLLSF